MSCSIPDFQGPDFKLWHGDSLMVLRELPAESVDAVITDPPYNSGGTSSAARSTQTPRQKYQSSDTARQYSNFGGDQRDQRGFTFWCHLWLSECYRVARDGSPILLFTDWRQLPVMTDVLQAADFVWRGVTVWDKTRACRPARGRFANQAEYIIWGSKGAMPVNRGVGCLDGVFTHVVRQADKFHLTGKPTPLMEDLVQICRPGGRVLDPFVGSGTTGVAAIKSGRSFWGVERELAYWEIANQRLNEVTGHSGVLGGPG
jgi:site-specific DNA-methyltransferase (adenine-specific)